VGVISRRDTIEDKVPRRKFQSTNSSKADAFVARFLCETDIKDQGGNIREWERCVYENFRLGRRNVSAEKKSHV
jgi:hypothetical protein